jgi:glycogen(starch) synthase
VKLLLYAHSWAPSVGGVETSTRILAEGLTKLSARHPAEEIAVTLATQTPAGNMNDSQLPYVVVRKLGFRDLIREIRSADVIHLAGPTLLPLIIGYLLHKPTVIEHHGYQVGCLNGMLLLEPQKARCPGHFMAGRYGSCLTCTSHTLGWWMSLRTLLLIFPRRWLCKKIAANVTITDHVSLRLVLPRSRTIYYGIENVAPRTLQVQEDSAKPLRIAYVGRLVSEKGLPILFRAVQRLQEHGLAFHLTVIGDGPERNRLQALANEVAINQCVTFTGELERREVDRALRDLDVVVMPSLCEETAGLAAIEQMMSGGAVIVSDIAGLSEVVADTGLKFVPGDSQGLFSCLEVVARDRSKIKQLGSLARARALQEFSVERFIIQHAALYREVQKQIS